MRIAHDTSASTERLAIAALFVSAITVLFVDASVKELHGTAVFYASLVREIVESGQWMGVYTDERAYLLKPPLAVWLAAASGKIFGLSNFAVTFPSRLGGVICVLLTYALVRRWWPVGMAFIAAFTLLTNSTFIQFSATLRMDSLLLAGMLCSLVGWAYRDAKWSAAALFGGVSVAVLSKGPLGLASIPLIGAHALLLRRSPFRRDDWRWLWLLLPIVFWYGILAVLHGARPFSELGSDALRATAAPEFEVWRSAIAEYVVKPFRRYWPWLPLILLGAAIALKRAFDTLQTPDYRAHCRWFLLWAVIVWILAALKPDHDIRYLFPALPALGLFAALAFERLTRDRFPNWVPLGAWLIVAAISLARLYGPWKTEDTRATIAAIAVQASTTPEILALGGFPVRYDQPRRQNTHRDWIHFYTGRIPRVLSWSQVRSQQPDLSAGVLLTNSRGHQARLEEFGLVAKYVTKEMILAMPQ